MTIGKTLPTLIYWSTSYHLILITYHYLFFIFCNEYFKYFFRYDYLSLNDDGLLTPNSTVNSITADYTRELILSQNRRSNLLGTNTNSSNGHSNDSISSPPSNSKVWLIRYGTYDKLISYVNEIIYLDQNNNFGQFLDFFNRTRKNKCWADWIE